MKFTKQQQTQIELAKEISPDSVSILEENPTWSSTLMNVVLNQVKDGKDYASFVTFANACSPSKEEPDKIGDYDKFNAN